jgi:hypothetical protein
MAQLDDTIAHARRLGAQSLPTSTEASRQALISGAGRKGGAIRMHRLGRATSTPAQPAVKTRYTRLKESAVSGDTTIQMQKANRHVLHTIKRGIKRTGRAVTRGLGRSAKAIKRAATRTGRWAKKHKTGLIISALTTAGMGGVGGAVQGVADYNAAQRDKDFTATLTKTIPSDTATGVMVHGSNVGSSSGSYGGSGGGGGGGDGAGYMTNYFHRYGGGRGYKQATSSKQKSSAKKKRKINMVKSRKRKTPKKMSKALKQYLSSLRRRSGPKKYKQRKASSSFRKRRKRVTTFSNQKRLAF